MGVKEFYLGLWDEKMAWDYPSASAVWIDPLCHTPLWYKSMSRPIEDKSCIESEHEIGAVKAEEARRV